MGNSENGGSHKAWAQGNMVAALEPIQHDDGAQTWSERWHQDLTSLPAGAWDQLVEQQSGGTPFLRHAFLSALAHSASACPDTGWHPRFLTLHDADGVMRAACPLYMKTHSYGEYVFDWAWADAYNRAFAQTGQRYFPKLLSAVPFTPVPGPRLLIDGDCDEAEARMWHGRLLQAISQQVQRQGWSSAHVLFPPEQDAHHALAQGWLQRDGVQFHWHNREPAPYVDFDDFLAGLQRDKRKKIKQERRKVADAGVSFNVLEGKQITSSDWDFFYHCYTQTYLEHGQRPYLTRAFWGEISQQQPDNWVLFVAELNGQAIAAALLAVDWHQRLAYGRYWGAIKTVSCLHFEACYYQPLAWCIQRGMKRFEGGAQGEHKLARGLQATPTRSLHWLPHEGFRHAVADFLHREQAHVQLYIDELDDRKPFKHLDEPN